MRIKAMIFDEIRNMLVDVELEKLMSEYNVEIKDKTMIINKKIPVQDFVKLRKKIRRIEEIDNIIVDADVKMTEVIKIL